MWTSESARRALETASPGEWDALLGDASFLVHVGPEALARTVPVHYRPGSEAAGRMLAVHRSVAHRLSGLDPAGRAQVLSTQAIRFGNEDDFTAAAAAAAAAAVDAGAWSCLWSSAGSTPHGLLAQLPQPHGESVAVGCSDGRWLAVTGDSDDAALRVWDLEHGTQIGHPLPGHSPEQEGGVSTLALLTGDGEPVAVSAGVDDTVRCWDVLKGRQIGDTLDCGEDGLRSMAAVRVNGALLVLVGGHDALHVWGDHGGGWERPGPALPHVSQVRAVATAEVDGVPVAVTGCADGTLRVWDLARHEAVGPPLHGHVGAVDAITTAELDGRAVALTAGTDRAVRIWDLHDRSAVGMVPLGGTTRVSTLAVLPHALGLDVLVGSAPPGQPVDSVSRFVLPHSYRVRGGTVVTTPTPVRAAGLAVAVVDGRRTVVAAGGPDGTTHLWDLDAVTPSESAGHRDEVNVVVAARVAGTPVLLTGGEDGTVRAWDRSTGAPVGRPLQAGPERGVEDLAVTDLGGRDLLVSCHGQEEVRVWDLAERQLLAELHTDDCDWVRGVDTARIGGRPTVISTGGWGTQLWDLASARELKTEFDADSSYFKAVATARIDGRPVAVTAAPAGQVRVWDLERGETFRLVGHRLDVDAVSTGEFDGVPLALTSASYGTTGDVRLWNLATRECLAQFDAGRTVRALALTRIGTRTVAFTGGDDTVHAWDCAAGRPVATLRLPDSVTALAWDEDRLAVCYGNETAVFTLRL